MSAVLADLQLRFVLGRQPMCAAACVMSHTSTDSDLVLCRDVSNNKQLCGSLPAALPFSSTKVKADGTSLGQPCTAAGKPVLADRAAVGGGGSTDNPAGSPSGSGSKLSSEWDK